MPGPANKTVFYTDVPSLGQFQRTNKSRIGSQLGLTYKTSSLSPKRCGGLVVIPPASVSGTEVCRPMLICHSAKTEEVPATTGRTSYPVRRLVAV